MGPDYLKKLLTGLLAWQDAPSSEGPQTSDAPRVPSTSGLAIGHRAPNRSETFEFLGIKYGQAPVGSLRFARPERYIASPDTVYNASNWVRTVPFVQCQESLLTCFPECVRRLDLEGIRHHLLTGNAEIVRRTYRQRPSSQTLLAMASRSLASSPLALETSKTRIALL